MKKGRFKSVSVMTTLDNGESILIIQLPMRISMSKSRILVSRVMIRMCLLLLMPLRMRALRENATIATSLGIRR